MKTLNNLYPGELEFTLCFNYDSLPFLDLRIFRNSEGFFNTDLFVKPTFKNLYLNYNSYHSKHFLENIAYGQALRIRTICSTKESAHKNLNTLKSNLIERGYPTSIVNEKVSKTCTIPRRTLLNRNRTKCARNFNAPPPPR
ncbi:hypothetical protein HOLleu_04614 [Holothuria leucospilota]|uniref:Helix-turn-helix domain-containing protein n=1 Tax=Holothuria leucospilota TaxID=206669 RepID=A0A9Q1CSA2_HOLLE|nr:hypothetical protein HOLleu_04614 [Holothuria leucospilota]